MSDIFSELSKLLTCGISHIDGMIEYDKNGAFVLLDDLLKVTKKYSWHPVSDEPESDGLYLVTLCKHDFDGSVIVKHAIWYSTSKSWCILDMGITEPTDNDVELWKIIPLPYEQLIINNKLVLTS